MSEDNTEFILVESWSELGDWDENSWPPPDEFALYTISGGLADKIRAKLGKSDATVKVETRVSEGGWSEWTNEFYYDFTLIVDDVRITLVEDSNSSPNELKVLIDWLES